MHRVWQVTRGLTLGTRGMVLDADGRVFLVEHSYVPGWHLPGGGVEPGETLVESLARELREEGNIELAAAPVLHAIYHHPLVSTRDHVALYVVRSFHQPSPPLPNHEIIRHGFFPVDALPEGTTRATRARISEVLFGAPTPERW